METHHVVVLGFIINLLGTYAYARDTLIGKTKPNRVTYLMWTLAPFVAVFAALADGVTWAVIPVVSTGLCPFIVLLASFKNKKAEWKLNAFDWLCGALSVLGIVLWQISNEPDIAIAFSIFADGAAAFPTIIKTWKHPETETPIGYVGSALGGATSFFALKAYSFAELAFPIYVVFVCSLIALLAYSGQRAQRKKARLAGRA
ncbi:MAG: hypothetical protein PHW63_07295 [Alphaproteobacteria bacterium]|nr:hypothetical protein [Alphaproteobacteria bacterium]